MLKIGNGYDVHRLQEERKLILGGVEIPSARGLMGHSDADVLLHAVMDSLLSAAGEADIGVQFPNTDLRYSGISSLVLLKEVDRIVRDKGFSVLSLSVVLICERPRLAPYLAAMKENIASALGLSADQVGLTVTTNEGLGFTGREEGVAAHAVCLLEK